jgi:uncharacterized protein (TIGR03083 family)
MAGQAFISDADERLDDLRAEVWRVEALGQRLHPGAWEMPSRCDLWSISDVYAHLAGDFERYMGWLADALEGNAEPPFERGELAADNEIILERYTGVSGPERLEAFVGAANQYLRAVADVDPETPQGNPMGQITVGEQVSWATVECAIHGWDVATALGVSWPGPASADRLARIWRQRRNEPLIHDDPWVAMLAASGRDI